MANKTWMNKACSFETQPGPPYDNSKYKVFPKSFIRFAPLNDMRGLPDEAFWPGVRDRAICFVDEQTALQILALKNQNGTFSVEYVLNDNITITWEQKMDDPKYQNYAQVQNVAASRMPENGKHPFDFENDDGVMGGGIHVGHKICNLH